MSCPICDKEFEKNIIYENDKIIVMSAPNAASSGHIQIYPKQHHAIFEEVPQDIVNYMAIAMNKISMMLFELLKVHGTNIIIQNGIPAGQKYPHFCVNIIPRRTDDGLKLDWDTKQANPESLDSIQRIITEGIAPVDNKPVTFLQDQTPQNIEKISDKEDDVNENNKTSNGQEQTNISSEESPKEKKVNYYLKSLERIP